MSSNRYEVAVIGAGPGGYVAAIKAAQLGAKVALIEGHLLGGTCLNVGCIPTKALLASAHVLYNIQQAQDFGIEVGPVRIHYEKMKARKDAVVTGIRSNLERLILANRIEIIPGMAKLHSTYEIKVRQEAGYKLLEASKIILATGSSPRSYAPFNVDGKKIHNSTTILELTSIPKSLVIVGGGYIGCEFATLFQTLGTKVTIVEALDRLVFHECIQSSRLLTQSFTKIGVQIHTQTKVLQLDSSGDTIRLELSNGQSVESEMCLVAIGRKLTTDQLGLESVGVYVEPSGAIPVNERMQTNLEHIFAIGDITAKGLLAHLASHQGLVAASNACGKRAVMHYHAVPAVIFTEPEIASVGFTLEKAQSLGYQAQLAQFPFHAIGKAQAAMQTNGFSQLVVEKNSGRILGAQIAGYEAGNLIAQMALAIQNELTLECITQTIHAHPTLAEAWLETALLAANNPVHLPPKK